MNYRNLEKAVVAGLLVLSAVGISRVAEASRLRIYCIRHQEHRKTVRPVPLDQNKLKEYIAEARRGKPLKLTVYLSGVADADGCDEVVVRSSRKVEADYKVVRYGNREVGHTLKVGRREYREGATAWKDAGEKIKKFLHRLFRRTSGTHITIDLKAVADRIVSGKKRRLVRRW